jgi:hypothetical protein
MLHFAASDLGDSHRQQRTAIYSENMLVKKNIKLLALIAISPDRIFYHNVTL